MRGAARPIRSPRRTHIGKVGRTGDHGFWGADDRCPAGGQLAMSFDGINHDGAEPGAAKRGWFLFPVCSRKRTEKPRRAF